MKRPIVIDASVAAGWLLPDEEAPLELMISLATSTAHVPAVFRTKVCNLLNMAVRRQRVDPSFAVGKWGDFIAFRLKWPRTPTLSQFLRWQSSTP